MSAAVEFVQAGVQVQFSGEEGKMRRGRPTSFVFRENCSALHMSCRTFVPSQTEVQTINQSFPEAVFFLVRGHVLIGPRRMKLEALEAECLECLTMLPPE